MDWCDLYRSWLVESPNCWCVFSPKPPAPPGREIVFPYAHQLNLLGCFSIRQVPVTISFSSQSLPFFFFWRGIDFFPPWSQSFFSPRVPHLTNRLGHILVLWTRLCVFSFLPRLLFVSRAHPFLQAQTDRPPSFSCLNRTCLAAGSSTDFRPPSLSPLPFSVLISCSF